MLLSAIEYMGTDSLREVDEQGRQAGAHPIPADDHFVGSAVSGSLHSSLFGLILYALLFAPIQLNNQ